MGSTHKVFWTQQREDQLERLWNQKISAFEIARTMGEPYNKNMILGKSWRMGLTRRTPLRPDEHKYRWSPNAVRILTELWPTAIHWSEIRDQINPCLTAHALKSKASSLGLHRPPYVQRKLGAVPTLPPPPVDPPPEERKTFVQLKKGDCRYPIGDPLYLNHTYCARKATHGSYCKSHHDICHVRVQP